MFSTSVKAVLIVLNVIIFAGGAALVAIGLLMKFDTGFLYGDSLDVLNNVKYKNLPMGTALETLAYTSIGFGFVIMALGIAGLFGAWKEIKGCMYYYMTSVAFILLMEATLVGIWIVVRGRNNEWLRGSLLAELQPYAGPTATDDVSKAWNDLFMKAHCCGVNDQFKDGGTNSDFVELPTTWTATASDNVPATCCQGVDSDSVSSYVSSSHCTTTPSNFYTNGCYDEISDTLDLYSLVTISICATIALCQVVSFVAACVSIGKTKRTITPARHHEMGRDSVSRPPPYVAIEKWMQNRNRRKELNDGYRQ